MNEMELKLACCPMGVYRETGGFWKREVTRLFKEGKLKVVRQTPNSGDFSDDRAVSTYDRCYNVSLYHNSSDLQQYVLVQIWNGDMMYGDPTTLRAEYHLQGAWWESEKIANLVQRSFEVACYDLAVAEENARIAAQRKVRAEQIGIEKMLLVANKRKAMENACTEQS